MITNVDNDTSFCCLLAVVEGLALLDLGVSPYSGDVFHEVRDDKHSHTHSGVP